MDNTEKKIIVLEVNSNIMSQIGFPFSIESRFIDDKLNLFLSHFKKVVKNNKNVEYVQEDSSTMVNNKKTFPLQKVYGL